MPLCLCDVFMSFDIIINDRLNPQNEAAKRGLERLEKQMKVCSFYLFILFFIILMLNNISLARYLHSFYLKE